MNSTPQAAALHQMSRTTGSNMIVRSAAGKFNEMEGTSPLTSLRQERTLWLDLKTHRVDSCRSKCVPSFDYHHGADGGLAQDLWWY
jgi:hypothetical protein